MLSLQSAITVQFAITVFFLKDMGWKHTACHIINADPGHALKAAIEQNFENNFYQSVQKHCGEGKREKHWQLQSVMRLKRERKKLEWQLQGFLRFRQTQKINFKNLRMISKINF